MPNDRMHAERQQDLTEFCSILDRLETRIGGTRKLADCGAAYPGQTEASIPSANLASCAPTQVLAQGLSGSGRTPSMQDRARNCGHACRNTADRQARAAAITGAHLQADCRRRFDQAGRAQLFDMGRRQHGGPRDKVR
jgi:hypothetical protein